jgi:hypothetical protein
LINKVIDVADLFSSAGLELSCPPPWRTSIPERQPGIYVVVTGEGLIDVSYLPPGEHDFWIPGQSIVYIGCTKRPLRRRLNEFYRHQYGNASPHRGGEALKLLTCKLSVYWARSDDPHHSEHVLIEAFKKRSGGWRPFGIRRNERRQ